MIKENYIQAAISLKREYIKISSDLNKYMGMSNTYLKNIDDCIKDLEKIQNRLDNDRNSKLETNSSGNHLNDILAVLDKIDNESLRVERIIESLNSDIEKLGQEEQILYKRICDSHPELSENQIVEIIRLRILREGLS